MQTIDILITNVHVLTMDEEFHKFRKGAVAITGDLIIAIGNEEDLVKEYHPKQLIDGKGKVKYDTTLPHHWL